MPTKARAVSARAAGSTVSVTGGFSRAFRDAAPSVAANSVPEKRPRRRVGERLYQETWQDVRDLFYEPARLERWHRWEHRFDSEINSIAGSMECANKMLKSLKDPYTELTKRGFAALRSDKEPVTSTLVLPDNVGYVRLKSFYPGTTAFQLRRALRTLSVCRALVLDLRGNGGGSTDQAIDCAELFLDEGGVVTFEGRICRSQNFRRVEISLVRERLSKRIKSGETERVVTAKRRYRRVVRKDVRIAVLTDGDTASSSELLLGALRDNGRVIVIGTPTFGKGIGQSVRHLRNGCELSVTTFRYMSPNGHWAGDAHRARNPFQPDIYVEGRGRVYRSSLKRDKQLFAAWQYLLG